MPRPAGAELAADGDGDGDAGSTAPDYATGSAAPAVEQDTAAVRAVWQQLGLPGLVDVHVHFMPERVLAKVWAYFDGAGSLVGQPWPIAYRTGEADRLGRLRAMGVRAFPSLLYPHKPGMAAWLNDWAAAFAAGQVTAGHDDVIPTATFYPEPEAGAYVRAALDQGARLCKAHVQVGAYDPRDPLLEPVWGQLAEAGVPVVVHCGNGPVPGRFTGPEVFAQVLDRHPRLVAVIAHMGMPDYEQFLVLASRYDGVHLDTTMAFTDFTERLMPSPPGMLPRLVDLQPRVLLGSDFPNTPYPYGHQLEALARLDLGDAWLRAVLHDNGARLLAVGTR